MLEQKRNGRNQGGAVSLLQAKKYGTIGTILARNVSEL
jgi:hypothetical protein